MSTPNEKPDPEALETREWLESLDDVLARGGRDRVLALLAELKTHAHGRGIHVPYTATTPYINTIPPDREVPYPGDLDIERRIRSIIRWNAMAMVVRANRRNDGIGGHISTYASAATLYEVGFHHFFRAPSDAHPGDLVYFQGHASPGIYGRAYLEGRFDEQHLENFRLEAFSEGLSSYPHPWLMPDFWSFPTVSMGLGPIQAIYQARFLRYLEDRGLKPRSDQKVWCFVGDGETDEPESLGAITLASREKLDNLIFVVNCNLQRLDGPVRGNGKIIQELEAIFRGAGWNVIKTVWGNDWDPLLARDREGRLQQRMDEVIDGQYQKYTVESGAYIREHFFGKYPELLKLVSNLSDDDLRRLRRGGHDTGKVYNAYLAATRHEGQPTVILAKTIKGYGMGEAGEGKNITHQQKKLNEEELRAFRSRFGIPIPDAQVAEAPFYRPEPDSPEMRYLRERREALGGSLPARRTRVLAAKPPAANLFEEFRAGSDGREVSTTMVVVRILSKLLRDPDLGRLIVPIVPDEARTFGMEALFRQAGIYASTGQLYEPVDRENLLYYKEAKDGQILEEGITEAGSMSSFIAAGTAYANLGIPTIPIFIYYSMFGLQRVGDLVWAAADSRARGFMIGATAGRTTLAGEGLQHQDGHSHLLAMPVPTMQAWDPAFAWELAVILEDGLRRMAEGGAADLQYITVTNENYVHPPMPEGDPDHLRDHVLRGMYRISPAPEGQTAALAILASGAILPEALQAQARLADDFGVLAEVWSVTSWKKLREDALECERWNRWHPGETLRRSHLETMLADAPELVVAASDYMKALPDLLAPWLPGRLESLGTDGFGRSDTREALRNFFEVDATHIAAASLAGLSRRGKRDTAQVRRELAELGIDPERPDPRTL